MGEGDGDLPCPACGHLPLQKGPSAQTRLGVEVTGGSRSTPPGANRERETSLTPGNDSTEELDFSWSRWDSERVLSSELNAHRLTDPLFKARSAPACYFTRQGACLEFPLSWQDCKQTLS